MKEALKTIAMLIGIAVGVGAPRESVEAVGLRPRLLANRLVTSGTKLLRSAVKIKPLSSGTTVSHVA